MRRQLMSIQPTSSDLKLPKPLHYHQPPDWDSTNVQQGNPIHAERLSLEEPQPQLPVSLHGSSSYLSRSRFLWERSPIRQLDRLVFGGNGELLGCWEYVSWRGRDWIEFLLMLRLEKKSWAIVNVDWDHDFVPRGGSHLVGDNLYFVSRWKEWDYLWTYLEERCWMNVFQAIGVYWRKLLSDWKFQYLSSS